MPTTPPPQPAQSSRSAWLTLVLAGAFEVGYALSVGGSRGFSVLPWSAVAVVFFLLTLWTLSLALRTIEVSIGYAIWAGIGAVGAALLGPIVFDEPLTPAKAAWLAVIITGVIVLKLADRRQGSGPGPEGGGLNRQYPVQASNSPRQVPTDCPPPEGGQSLMPDWVTPWIR